MLFGELNVNENIVKALAEIGITNPTLIQEKSIPLIKAGKDVIGISKTGSGKTAAFGVPALEKIVPGNGVQALVVVPTRELAVQISNEMKKFGKYMNFNVAVVFGGVSLGPQMDQIARSEIVVGTPGRLLDHLRRKTLKLSGARYVVLDEADKMVEMGFIEDIEQILNATSKERQTLLFGATISNQVGKLKQRYMHNPEVVQTERHVKPELLAQFYYDVPQNEKFSLLVHLLKKPETQKALVFCSARSTVEIVARNLRKNGVKAEMMHGKLSQNKRLSVVDNFNKGYPNILVASAVASRGLDIKDITHVFNYDLSNDPQEYIHRIGRTARAGEAGKAITLLSQRDYDAFDDIHRRHSLKIDKLPREEFPKVNFEAKRFNSSRPRFGQKSFGRGGSGRGGFSSGFGRGQGRGSSRFGRGRQTGAFSAR